MIVDQHTGLYGVIGNPIGHSLSPIMHNAAFSQKGINAVFMAFETGDPDACIKGMKGLGIKGMAVTIPYKVDVIPLLDEVDELAGRIGAINTIVNRGGRLVGYNTDGIGALKALEERAELSGKSCIMIGAGGAARAIGYVLMEKGIELTVANRSVERGKSLCRALGCRFINLEGLLREKADILINTTPVGMAPGYGSCLVPEKALQDGMVVMDIVYNPLETRLIAMAGSRGCITISGLAMFIYQGAEQFRLWTGLEPPIDVMKEVVERFLHDRD
jgi:shikimate dehydrogenase